MDCFSYLRAEGRLFAIPLVYNQEYGYYHFIRVPVHPLPLNRFNSSGRYDQIMSLHPSTNLNLIDGHFVVNDIGVDSGHVQSMPSHPSTIPNMTDGHFVAVDITVNHVNHGIRNMIDVNSDHSHGISSYPSTIRNMIDGHFVTNDINVYGVNHGNRVNRDVISVPDPHGRHVGGGDHHHKGIIARYLRKSQVISSQENTSCSICQEHILYKETIGVLDCSHNYHIDCIKQWLLIQNKCPNCRATALLIPV